jgi:luciferase family oxidoreductase group 1
MLQQPGAQSPDYGDQVRDILALLAGDYVSPEGIEAHAIPGEGATIEVWALGSSAGQSAQVAGAEGLPFAANYHVSPATVLAAVNAYRAAFRPSRFLDQPYVIVSADAVVAEDDATARWLASPYALWVRSVRSGDGAMPYPSPEDAAAHVWTDEDKAMVADRVDTQFVGAPASVAKSLAVLQDATAADELMIVTNTHAHPDRIRSYELLAREWGTCGSQPS